MEGSAIITNYIGQAESRRIADARQLTFGKEWDKFGQLFGWELKGWTKEKGEFTRKHAPRPRVLFNISRSAREDILSYIDRH